MTERRYDFPERIHPEELDACLKLSQIAGWNQTPEDWKAFIDLGTVVATKTMNGEIVGTLALLPLGNCVSWISLVLVDPSHRKLGIANNMMTWAIERCKNSNRLPMLDATEAGAQVYSKLGFTETGPLFRYRIRLKETRTNPSDPSPPVRRIEAKDLGQMKDWDAPDEKIDRSSLYAYWLKQGMVSGWIIDRTSEEHGFVLIRRGDRHPQIGPLMASNKTTALQLFQAVLNHQPSETWIMDVTPLGQLLLQDSHCFDAVLERPFTRMQQGLDAIKTNPCQYAIGGPEYS